MFQVRILAKYSCPVEDLETSLIVIFCTNQEFGTLPENPSFHGVLDKDFQTVETLFVSMQPSKTFTL